MSIRTQRTDIAARAAKIAEELSTLEGPLLPILHELQHEFGHIPTSALPVIAEALNLSRAEVYGVVSFYHDFRREPAGRHVLKLCRSEACQSMGGEAIADQITKALGVKLNETSADGALTIEPVYCLGLCACAPAALFDGEPIGRLDASAVAEISARVKPGAQS